MNPTKKEGCPACDGPTISFGIDYLNADFNSAVVLTNAYPEIGIYQCTKCLTQFTKPDDDAYPHYLSIYEGQLALLSHWLSRNLEVKGSWLPLLKSIGGTGLGKERQVFPCRAIFRDGSETDFGILQVDNQPPLGYDYTLYHSVRFVDEVVKLESSPYALSAAVRLATLSAREARMGFYPSVARTSGGKKVVFNGFEMFCHEENVKGSDLSPTNEHWHPASGYLYASRSTDRTLIIARQT